MVKFWLVAIIIVMVSGCSGIGTNVRTETVTVERPVLWCPAPDFDALHRPQTLAIETITPSMSDGEIAVRYKATVKQLQSYVSRLEQYLLQYKKTSDELELLKQQIENQAVDE